MTELPDGALPPWLTGAPPPDPALAAAQHAIDVWAAAEHDRIRRQFRKYEAIVCRCAKHAGGWPYEPPQLGCMIHGTFVLAEDGTVL